MTPFPPCRPTPRTPIARAAAFAAASLALGSGALAEGVDRARVERIVSEAVRPVIEEHRIPGMAVAVAAGGRRYFVNFGVASRESGRPVDEGTIFEVGSDSKVLTGTLAAWAGAQGRLSLADTAARHMPALKGSPLGETSLLDLGTYVAGGLPLQVPEGVKEGDSLVAYFKEFRPAYPAGAKRVYSNPSIGLFGRLAAASLGEPFDVLMEKRLFPALGLASTFIKVPADRAEAYAFGYSRDDRPVRVNPGVLDAEAYGVKSTSADLIRFVEASMGGHALDETLRRALAATQAGYYRVGGMVQGLGWEMHPYPASLETLLASNSADMALKPNDAARLDPPMPAGGDVLVNKTGSTGGFGAYIAFLPRRGIGVVMLANRNYPNAARVRAAHRILTALDEGP